MLGKDPRAQFLRALIAHRLRRPETSMLIGMLPPDPATRVLAAMNELRAADEPTDLHLLVRAWKLVGCPDLQTSVLLPDAADRTTLQPIVSSTTDPRARFLLAIGQEYEPDDAYHGLGTIELAVALAADEAEDLDVRLLAANILRDTNVGDPRGVFEDAVLREPDNLYFQLALATDASVEELEHLAELSRFDWHFPETYRIARDAFADQLGPIASRTLAFSLAVGARRMEMEYLQRAVDALADPPHLERRCRALEQIARTIGLGPSLLDRMISTYWPPRFAPICGGLEDAMQRRREIATFYDPFRTTGPIAISRWPIVDPMEVDLQVVDEVAFYASLGRCNE